MIGLEKGVVKLAPYSAEWKQLFEQEKAAIWRVIGASILDIQHIGSTSIPGMLAKPIIDIGVAVTDFDEARVCILPLEGLGYAYRGEFGIPRRHYFTKGDPRLFHLHMCEVQSEEWSNQIHFRDFLIQHPELADEYAQLKVRLAEKYPTDREAYLEGKAPFIEKVLKMAKA
jgi:GrpB-like predicted nucleotidyltransferase (UPF0157 family)